MQWFMLVGWASLVLWGARTKTRALLVRILLTIGLTVSMLSQLWLLRLDGQLSLATGLPLHLCGMFGLLSAPLIWFSWPWLFNLTALLGAPCALLALCFPAMVQSSQPLLMSLAFYRLHVLIVCVALLLFVEKKPLPLSSRKALLFGNGYMLLVSVFNHLLQTNYLFLRAAPLGTPLAPLFSHGTAFYVCALEMLCMTLTAWLAHIIRQAEKLRSPSAIARNT